MSKISYSDMLNKSSKSSVKKISSLNKPSKKQLVNLMAKKLNKNNMKPKKHFKYPPKYINKNGYVVVQTPHITEMSIKRPDIFPKNLNKFYDKMFHQSYYNVRYGSYFDSNCYIYFRRIYNHIRRREELELISITPSNHFHTNNLKCATWMDL